jgi:hypothetical protein
MPRQNGLSGCVKNAGRELYAGGFPILEIFFLQFTIFFYNPALLGYNLCNENLPYIGIEIRNWN